MSVVSVDNLSVNINKRYILQGIDLSIDSGKVIGIIGPSGSGKSTLGRILAGYVISGARITGTITRNSGVRTGIILQDPYQAFDPLFKIKWHIRETLGFKKLHEVKEVLQRVGFDNVDAVLNKYPHELSGGMLQRLAVVMEMLRAPDLLIADEPTASIDAISTVMIIRVLKDFQNFGIKSMVLISHQLNLVQRLSDMLFVIAMGRPIESGPTEAVIRRPLHPMTGLFLNIDVTKMSHFDVSNTGCVFFPVCTAAQRDCQLKEPDFVKIDSNRGVACLHPQVS